MRATAAILLATSLLAGCGSFHRQVKDPASPPRQRVDICNTVYLANKDVLKPSHLTFTEVVTQNRKNKLNGGVSGYVTLGLPNKKEVDLGPYGPAIFYLRDRNLHWTKEFEKQVPLPKRTQSIIDSAKRLDRDLNNGLCNVHVIGGTTTPP